MSFSFPFFPRCAFYFFFSGRPAAPLCTNAYVNILHDETIMDSNDHSFLIVK